MEQHQRICYFELAIIALLLILSLSVVYAQVFFSYYASTLLLSLLVSFSLFVFLGALYQERDTDIRKRAELARHMLFAAALVSFLLIIVTAGFGFGSAVDSVFFALVEVAYFLVLFLPLFFFMFIGASIVRKDSRKLKVAAVLFLVAFLILVLYFSSGFLLRNLSINDEEFLQFHAAALTLGGINPYTVSFVEPLFYNSSKISVSLTTGNKIVGTMDYPALYFLSFIPFYLLTNPTLANTSSFDIPFQAAVYLFLLLLALAFSLKKQELLKPSIILFVFVLFGMLVTASVTAYLMLALVILAYANIGNKYVWVLLGLCAALQEEIWLPVILLLVYSMNSYGFKKGFRDMAGTLAVFLVINSYFIITAPAAYFSYVLTPLNAFYLPSGLGAVGSMFMSYYPVLMSTYTLLFDLAAVALILIFAYLNKKELVGLFSLLPLVFMLHVLPSYYTIFIALIFFSFFAVKDQKSMKVGALSGLLHRYRLVFASVMVLIIAFAAYAVLSSHAAYTKNFNISLVNETAVPNAAKNASYYSATLLYHNLSNSTVYAYALLYDTHGTYLLGLINYSIITSPHSAPGCGSYECEINVNELELKNTSGSYALTARLAWLNASYPVESVTIALYNGEYFYLGPAVTATALPVQPRSQP